MRSQTGGAISFGHGMLHSKSGRHKVTVKSFTEAEVVGMINYVPYNFWLLNVIAHQEYEIVENKVY